jgi:hypothetical protein
MASQRNNILTNSKLRADVAVSVVVQLQTLPLTSPWTMTITQARSGVYSVRTVIEESSEDTDVRSGELKFSDEHHNI